MPDEQDLTAYVNGVVSRHAPTVNGHPSLQSILYDIDLLPEQLLHVLRHNPDVARVNAMRMAAFCILWKQAFPNI